MCFVHRVGLRIGWTICRDAVFIKNLAAVKKNLYVCNSTLDGNEIHFIFFFELQIPTIKRCSFFLFYSLFLFSILRIFGTEINGKQEASDGPTTRVPQ